MQTGNTFLLWKKEKTVLRKKLYIQKLNCYVLCCSNKKTVDNVNWFVHCYI